MSEFRLEYVSFLFVSRVISIVAFITGSVIMAIQWHRLSKKTAEHSPVYTSLNKLKWLFIMFSLCGAFSILGFLFEFAHYVYIVVLTALAILTWQFAINSEYLLAVYTQIEKTDRLERELMAKDKLLRATSAALSMRLTELEKKFIRPS